MNLCSIVSEFFRKNLPVVKMSVPRMAVQNILKQRWVILLNLGVDLLKFAALRAQDKF
jgi:hypothetical protein